MIPTTLLNYIFGLQHGFKTSYGYGINIVFEKVTPNFFNDVFSVTNNKKLSLQGSNKTSLGHDFLGDKEIYELYVSNALS